jgi:hypothetical protein
MNRRFLAWTFIFFLIWLVLIGIDGYVLRTDYPYLPHDNDTSWFGVGLSWRAWSPRFILHHPSLSVNQIAGVLVSFIDISQTGQSIRDFELLGIAIQGAVVLIAGGWFAWAGEELKLDNVSRAFLVFLTFTFPTLLLYAGHWGNYFELAVLGLPLGVTIFLAIICDHPRALAVSGAGLGAMVANYYPAAALLGTIALALAISALWKNGMPKLRGGWRLGPAFDRIVFALLGVCTIIAAPVATAKFFQGPIFSRLCIGLLVGAFAWVISAVVYRYATLIDPRFRPLLGWAVIGFVLGAGVLLPGYPLGLLQASSQSGDIADSVTKLVFLTPTFPWLLEVWVALVCLIVSAGWLFVKRRSFQSNGAPQFTILAFSAISIIVIGVAAAGLLSPQGIPGLRERLFVAAVPALTAAWLVIFSILGRRFSVILRACLVVLSAFVVWNFYTRYEAALSARKQTGAKLDAVVSRFFHDKPDGLLICARDDYPIRYCAAAYAYNAYRGGRRRLPTRYLFGGKVLWTSEGDSIEELSKLLAPASGRPILIIGGGPYAANVINFVEMTGARVQVDDTTPVRFTYVTGLIVGGSGFRR